MNRVLLCIFPRIPSIPKELILFFSFNRSFKNSSIFLTLFKLFSIGCISQITLRHEGFSLGCNFQTVYLHKMQVSTGVPIYIDLHFIQNGTSRFLGSLSNPQSSRNEDTMKAKRNQEIFSSFASLYFAYYFSSFFFQMENKICPFLDQNLVG